MWAANWANRLADEQLVHLYEAISVPNADALFLVLEYMPGGTLMEVKIGHDEIVEQAPFPLHQAWEYFRQLCLGLEYLHANEVVHRDVS
jgi:[calcium/calmodulin-dependent protein kinase] kinase